MYSMAHPFHLVTPSPWPLVLSFATISIIISLALTMHGYAPLLLFWLGLTLLAISIILWFRDITIEGTLLGDHTIAVKNGLSFGFLLFVLSECLVFAALFWAYLHSAINPTVDLGLAWAPADIIKVNATELPLLNTIILLSSGATVTYSHHSWIGNNKLSAVWSIVLTWALIFVFVALQFVEYALAQFTITDGVYGSVFYAGTGLHIIHMITLIAILGVVAYRIIKDSMESTSSINLDLLIVYSHVLDVIWLALFVVFYVWV